MTDQFSRTELLIGKEGIKKLKNSAVAVFGIGGVGSYAAEALARAGIGSLTLIDHDKVCLSNINRQIIALHSTVGQYKTQVMAERIADINKSAKVTQKRVFFCKETLAEIDFSGFDYVIDAVDTVTSKLLIIEGAVRNGVPVISCMGAGNKLNANFLIDYVENTKVCPLAKVMRSELKKRGISGVLAVYSQEKALKPQADEQGERTVGSISYVPPSMGFAAAGQVIRDLLKG